MKTLQFCWCLPFVACGNVVALGQGTLYTEGPGTNPPFEQIRDQITSSGYLGQTTTIQVNNAAVEGGVFGALVTQGDLRFHTLGNSSVFQSNMGNWDRWYQTDGATQIFRLFPGEENVRDNGRPLAARIEAFDINNGWNVDDGEWFEWVGRYTIVKPINASILQVKDVDDDDWSVQIGMSASGRVFVNHRSSQFPDVTLIPNATNQPFDIRVRDNGLDYEVYFGDLSYPITTGRYARNTEPGDNTDTRFRWGMYVGSREVTEEGMIFVSHASINPGIDFPPPPFQGKLIAGWDTWSTGIESPSSTDFGAAGLATESSGDWREDNEAASNDGTFGTMAGASTATGVASTGTHIGTTTGRGSYDFTVTAGAYGLVLESFRFDARRKRSGSPGTWSVTTVSGAIETGVTIGSGSLGNTLGGPGPSDHDDFDLDLRRLADNELAPGESATFRINFADGTLINTDQRTYLDNVAVFGFSDSPTGPPGDFNDDGVVNAADYTVWRNNLGAPAYTLPNDTTDGVIGIGQYELWKNNFGAFVPPRQRAAAAIPEPASPGLCGLLSLLAIYRRYT